MSNTKVTTFGFGGYNFKGTSNYDSNIGKTFFNKPGILEGTFTPVSQTTGPGNPFPLPDSDGVPATTQEQQKTFELPVEKFDPNKPQPSAPTTTPQPSNTNSSASAADPYSGPYIWKYK
jgi:hypothetical protein